MSAMCQATQTQQVPAPTLTVGPGAGGQDFGSNADQAQRLDADSVDEIENFLDGARRLLDDYGAWRRGDHIGQTRGEFVPNPQRLQDETKHLHRLKTEDGTGRAMADPIVRDALSGGAGVAPLTQEHLGWIQEWASYALDTPGLDPDLQLVDLFCLKPESITHTLTMNVEWERGISAGAGPGILGPLTPCVDLAILDVGAGACVEVGFSVAKVSMAYGNSTDLGWTSEYIRYGPDLGGSAGANIELFPAATGPSNHGNAELCKGKAVPMPSHYVGPLGMTGMTVRQEANSSLAYGDMENETMDVAETLAGRFVVRSAWGEITFDTSGTCGETKWGAGGEASLTALAPAILSQMPGSEPGATPAKDVSEGLGNATGEGACMPELGPEKETLLITASLYFPKGSVDLYEHLENASTIGFLSLSLLNESDAHGAPTASRVVIAGHASPVWAGAKTDEERVANNSELAGARARVMENALLSVYDGLGGQWPALSVDADSEAKTVLDAQGMGSSEGEAATGDPCLDDAQLQRVDVSIYVMRAGQPQ